ncbi:MAG: twin-arginine translocase TatA/TatE family subunit [Campylobacteraceae bacterium]|jgi:sec-independent protein translocase protein TatA|nr:twin-arginine translocase TatA/TatE family subunit [Campylobacteraceae bacterium]
MLANIGWPGLLIILLIVVFLFGGRRIAEVAKGLGAGLRNFKQAVKEEGVEEIEEDTAQEAKIEKPKNTTKAKTKKTTNKA